MITVRLKTLMSGPAGVVHPGETIEVEDAHARQLIAGNYATEINRAIKQAIKPAIKPAPPREIAVAPAAEHAVMPRPARKPGRKFI